MLYSYNTLYDVRNCPYSMGKLQIIGNVRFLPHRMIFCLNYIKNSGTSKVEPYGLNLIDGL